MSRWRDQAVLHSNESVSMQAARDITLAKPADGKFGDFKMNSDNSSATFNQRSSDVAHFSDGRGVIVWEDERNGIWRIAAQPITVTGAKSGANKFLDNENPPSSLRQPRVAANTAGTVVIVYIKESDNGLYARAYDFGISTGGAEIRIDDATPGNFINQPDITPLSANRFVVVWEDSRDGSNIFAQILNSDGSASGDNFQINPSIPSPYRIAPSVVSTQVGDFAVVWEDGRSGNGDVYFRIFTEIGTPLFPELRLDEASASDFQFMPKVEFLKGNTYLATWISNRDGGQSIFGQLISTSSANVGSTFRVNDSDSDLCWDLNVISSVDSGAVCVWAEYSTTASIEVQKISKSGTLSGSNLKLEDAALLRERSFPAIARNSSGFTAAWVDARSLNLDIYAQRTSTSLVKVNTNYRVNDDNNGAQQSNPDIAGITAGVLATVWDDRKADQGDITMQLVTSAATYFGNNIRVNDDNGSAIQKNPRVGAATNGIVWTVWEDARTEGGLLGQNIFTQRFDGSGNRQGQNLLVNDDGTSKPKSNPDIDVADNGKVTMTWVDERDNSKQVYVQGFASNGAPLGGNLKVTEFPTGTQNLEPHVGVRNDESYVVAWLAILGGKQVAYFQRYAGTNAPLGVAHMVEVDTSIVQTLDVDICAHRTSGKFVVATIERENGATNVKMYAYDQSGNAITGGVVVSDVPGSYSDVRISRDAGNAVGIVWLSTSGALKRGYVQIMRDDGFALGSNQLICGSTANRVEATPAISLTGGYYFAVWTDTRDANAGFDVFVNSSQYTSTDAEDEIDFVLPAAFSLGQNFPNPFNPETSIEYSLQSPAKVTLTVYNILGQQVDELIDEYQAAGSHELTWNAYSHGGSAASGVYFYRLTVGDKSVTKKMTLLK
ncbi:MAG: T9SS type A sorting domain-containing protein [Candidatus Zixiibacteriota bacterium]